MKQQETFHDHTEGQMFLKKYNRINFAFVFQLISLPLIDRQIEGDASEDVFSVLQISEETDGDVKAGHDHHRRVQHTVPPHQGSWSSHLEDKLYCMFILYYKYYYTLLTKHFTHIK